MGNLVKRAVKFGGKLAPLVISDGLTSGTGLMNPSVFVDDDGDILVNLRHVNYTLCHSENTQQFPNRWGPLSYLHPEKDQTLRTENYICRLNEDLSMTDYCHVDMLDLHTPIWEFIGLEDARLVKWDGQYYLVGVRRDTTTIGQGRMEYTHVDLDKNNWTAKETKRIRIPAPGENTSYCEKNWVPILDKPYHFIKWTYPVEVVKANTEKEECEQVSLKSGVLPPTDQRGSSHVVPWGNMYISISHEVDLFKNYLNQKDAYYRHRLLLWDDQMNLVGFSKKFSFLDARIEFVAGAAVHNGDLLITFGFQDNAAFILRTPGALVEDLILEALDYEQNY
jgi:hypothetical protein